jgi:hypothetical protein
MVQQVYSAAVDGFRILTPSWLSNVIFSKNFTEPNLPGKTIVSESGVTVEHYYHAEEHGPAHAHVIGGGGKVRIGQNGKPLKGDPELSYKQRDVVDGNISEIRRALGKIGNWLDYKEQEKRSQQQSD